MSTKDTSPTKTSTRHVELSSDQSAALSEIRSWIESDQQVFSLRGLAGVGKSTLLSKIPRKEFSFCAPTGKAADVLRTKGLPSRTIHRLIYDSTEYGFVLTSKNLKDRPCIAIDEASMVSADVWRDLLKLERKILVVGDHGQLPPVGEDPHILHEPSFELTEIHRNAEDSPILQVAHSIRESPYPARFAFEKTVRDSSAVFTTVADALARAQSFDPSSTMIITAKNDTRLKISRSVRLWRGLDAHPFGVGDLLVCRRNNYQHGVYNGQLFYVSSEPDIDETNEIAVCNLRSYDDPETEILSVPISTRWFNTKDKPHYSATRDVGIFDFGYCLTAHSAQGSEFENVVVIEPGGLNYITDWPQRWRYTAVTRAKKNLVYASPKIESPPS